jgi:galactonate dehydratase
LKITQLTTYRVAPRWMFLKIDTDEGLAGWGEAVVEGRARTVETAVDEIGEFLIGKDPARINDHWQTMYRGAFYRGGISRARPWACRCINSWVDWRGTA